MPGCQRVPPGGQQGQHDPHRQCPATRAHQCRRPPDQQRKVYLLFCYFKNNLYLVALLTTIAAKLRILNSLLFNIILKGGAAKVFFSFCRCLK
jgi:hypothetical protein